MELTPKILEEFLEVLEGSNITEFSCSLFSFRRTQTVEVEAGADSDIAKVVARRAEERLAPKLKGVYGDKSLWKEREPADFFRAEKPSTSPYAGESE